MTAAYDNETLRGLLPFPKRDANKYSRGHLVLVAGSATYPGAACLASMAGQCMGAGYTEVATDPSAAPLARALRPSLVVTDDEAWLSREPLVSSAHHPSACVVGPGFDPDDERSQCLLFHTLETADAPVLVDGGALTALATDEGRKRCAKRLAAKRPTVITPHGGEAARLAKPLGLPTDDAPALANALALAYGVTVALKGPVTWISDGEKEVCMDEGTSALAKAGTGDVLAGMIGSLLAQGLDPVDACLLAATLHARAARIAADELTAICVIAEDVIDYLPHAIKDMVATEAKAHVSR
ncbi:NAD(P)H-hydrate dehydratase [Raoultibacter phocaeensis]|uniref:NAD(P)H-hydrate dehydratase n=1 Tax=Raoultibacter phocaeensis TaxID=2479841 RepID=UPI00111A7438|nr:NAD(P)H-hydrate dehydratase [Raoultibacter phocaeensis]